MSQVLRSHLWNRGKALSALARAFCEMVLGDLSHRAGGMVGAHGVSATDGFQQGQGSSAINSAPHPLA